MEPEQKPPKKKKASKTDDSASEPAAGEEKTPRAIQGSGADTGRAESENPSREEEIANWRQPRTNQDEQEKITNTGDSDIPLPDK
jgi:hypothetical protein